MAAIVSKSGAMERLWSKDVLRVVCISDTHSLELRMKDIPAGDVLIHAGDFSSTGRLEEISNFRSFMDSLPHPQKIVIAGNHDITMETDYYVNSPLGGRRFHRQLFYDKSFDALAYSQKCRKLIETSSYPAYSYLEDSSCQLAYPEESAPTELLVYGAPWQPKFYDWAYNLPLGARLREKWDQIPEGVDVLITHGPPLGILDAAADGHECGCPDLLDTITQRVKPRLHIFGHIHEAYGELPFTICNFELDFRWFDRKKL